jgi:hypothetical protein
MGRAEHQAAETLQRLGATSATNVSDPPANMLGLSHLTHDPDVCRVDACPNEKKDHDISSYCDGRKFSTRYLEQKVLPTRLMSAE